jgi:microsomal dipeptidase-like Zn-dependent dipeptidase
MIRWQVIHQIQKRLGVKDSPKDPGDDARGAPDFIDWPTWDDLLHQKMWVEWVRRSYEGGLRVMVALAVNSKTLGDMTRGPGDPLPTDDRSSADKQLTELKAFVGRHTDFMGIATSPEELEQIIRENKLAVVLGIEVDAIGNFYGKTSVTNAEISAEIDRLFGAGVHYIFPIHRLDNAFGGAAVYDADIINYSNFRETGHWYDFQCVKKFTYNFKKTDDLLFTAGVIAKLGVKLDPPDYTPCDAGMGQANNLGLTPEQGPFAIKEMMRHGMLIDIDHMSEKAQDCAIKIAQKVGAGYPMNSGHNKLRVLGMKDSDRSTERSMPDKRYTQIGKLHGMAGIGTGDMDAKAFVTEYQNIVKAMGPGAVAGFGTDTNGLARGMPPRQNSAVHYSDEFPRSSLGTRWWDYNKDGVAHYGMLPDFLEDVRTLAGGKEVVEDGMMFGADYFLQTWKKCVKEKGNVH